MSRESRCEKGNYGCAIFLLILGVIAWGILRTPAPQKHSLLTEVMLLLSDTKVDMLRDNDTLFKSNLKQHEEKQRQFFLEQVTEVSQGSQGAFKELVDKLEEKQLGYTEERHEEVLKIVKENTGYDRRQTRKEHITQNTLLFQIKDYVKFLVNVEKEKLQQCRGVH